MTRVSGTDDRGAGARPPCCPRSSRVGLFDGRRDLAICAWAWSSDARLQPCDHLKIIAETTPASDPLALGNHVRDPQIGRTDGPDRIGHVRRHDADHFVRAVVERNRAADDVGVCIEAPLPERIADDRNAMAPVDFAFGRE